MKKLIALAVSSCLGAGYVPVAPGTAGSLLALPLAWALFQLGWWGVPLGAGIATILGMWASNVAEAHYRVHDSPHIVIDELAGQLVTLLPVACTRWPNLVVGFGLFRLFDTVKPWPANWIDRRLQGALGVMLDDVVAGVYAGAATALVVHTGALNRVVVWLHEAFG